MSEPALDDVFGALSDPTRRHVLEALVREGSTSVPALTAELPITRQAIAKHLNALHDAGLIERAPSGRGREVRYQLRPRALTPALDWMQQADAAWERRLARLKQTVEASTQRNGGDPAARDGRSGNKEG